MRRKTKPWRPETSSLRIYVALLCPAMARPDPISQAKAALLDAGGEEVLDFDSGPDSGASFLFLFERPVDAVLSALLTQRRQPREGASPGPRIGIHLGEVVPPHASPARQGGEELPHLEKLAQRTVLEMAQLARPGQTLLTQGAYALARRAIVGLPETEGLEWIEHGSYRFARLRDTLEIFQVADPRSAQPGLTAAPDDATVATRLAPPPGAPEPPGKRRALAFLVALILFSLAAFVTAWRWELLQPSPSSMPEHPTVAVLGFRDITGSGEAQWISTALSELLSSRLAAAGGLHLVSGESVARTRLELALPLVDSLAPDTLARLHESLGVDYVILGNFLLDGDTESREGEPAPEGEQERIGDPLAARLTVTAKLQDTRRGEIDAPPTQHRELASLPRLVEDLVADLYPRIPGLPPLPRPGSTVPDVPPQALRPYYEGLSHLHDDDSQRAAELLREATSLAPGSARAHAALADAWGRIGHERKALEESERAHQLAAKLPAAERLLIAARYYERARRWPEALAAYGELMGLHPQHLERGLMLARAQLTADQVGDASDTLVLLRQLAVPLGEDPRLDLLAAEIAERKGDFAGQQDRAQRAAAEAERRGAVVLVAEAQLQLGEAHRQQGRPEEAQQHFEQARATFAHYGQRSWEARALNYAAILAKYQADYARAEELYTRSLALEKEIGRLGRTALLRHNLALLRSDRGDLSGALALQEEALPAAREVGDQGLEASLLQVRSELLSRQGRLPEARSAAEASQVLSMTLTPLIRGRSHLYLGQVLLAEGKLAAARRHLVEANEILKTSGNPHFYAYAQASLGELLLLAGELTEADHRLQLSERARRTLGEPGTLAETFLIQARLALARGDHAAARDTSAKARQAFREQGRPSDELAAATVLAQAHLEAGDGKSASEILTLLRGELERVEDVWVRLRFLLVEALTLATGSTGDTERDIEAATRLIKESQRRADDLGLVVIAYEARLAAGKVASLRGERALARHLFRELEREVEQTGYRTLARQARSLLEADAQ